MFGFLLLGLIIPVLFSLIDREIGARSRVPQGRLAATLALFGVVFLWGLRDFEHRRAVNALASRTYQHAEPLHASAYPDLANPFRWYGVVETPAFFVLAPVNSLGPEVDPEGRLSIRYKPEETPVTLAAKKSYLGRVYLDWAKYPITEAETLPAPEGGYIVNFQDLRFAQLPSLFSSRDETRRALGAGVQLDKNLHVVADIYGSGKKQIAVPEPD
ncbi:MAG TPA: hypothetical protein VFE08_14170, partial [Candidatus Sulfotelmatobacter sp.]|nr:hypothetical protein [Candidatus Sulfotelmatobacter sp.]